MIYRRGGWVEGHFRNGSWVDGYYRSGADVDNTNRNRAPSENICIFRKCPECGKNVFFIKHNDGCVWIDPPLGAPWYKHECYSRKKDHVKDSLLSLSTGNEISNENFLCLVLGVVKPSFVHCFKEYTDVVLETGKSKKINLRIKNCASFLSGRLCVYDKQLKVIWPIEEPKYVYEIVEPFNRLINCPKCNVELNPRNLNRHLKRHHGEVG